MTGFGVQEYHLPRDRRMLWIGSTTAALAAAAVAVNVYYAVTNGGWYRVLASAAAVFCAGCMVLNLQIRSRWTGKHVPKWAREEPVLDFNCLATPAEARSTAQRIIDAGIKAGPDCQCGHERRSHVGADDLFGDGRSFGFFDGPCQIAGCVCTPAGYLPGDGSVYCAPDMIGRLDG